MAKKHIGAKFSTLAMALGATWFTASLSYGTIVDLISKLIVQKQWIEPETAHESFIRIAQLGLLPNYRNWPRRITSLEHREPELETHLWGYNFPSPIGVAAGLDKHAQAMTPLFNLDFGFVEVGTVTPEAQLGNPKPRVFRLLEEKAIINRYGFNSHGFQVVQSRLSQWRKDHPKATDTKKCLGSILGVNLGMNKGADPHLDYTRGVTQLGPFADYLVINISSPNTPGLRHLQCLEEIDHLLQCIMKEKNANPQVRDTPLLVKISPDLSMEEKSNIAKVALKHQINGLIVGNTTISRPDEIVDSQKKENGGLSGMPLRSLALSTLEDMYQLTGGQLPLIGVGGISNGQDAYDRILAGASLIQVYTSLAFHGPGIASSINQQLAQCLKRDGYRNVQEAVGAKVRIATKEHEKHQLANAD